MIRQRLRGWRGRASDVLRRRHHRGGGGIGGGAGGGGGRVLVDDATAVLMTRPPSLLVVLMLMLALLRPARVRRRTSPPLRCSCVSLDAHCGRCLGCASNKRRRRREGKMHARAVFKAEASHIKIRER